MVKNHIPNKKKQNQLRINNYIYICVNVSMSYVCYTMQVNWDTLIAAGITLVANLIDCSPVFDVQPCRQETQSVNTYVSFDSLLGPHAHPHNPAAACYTWACARARVCIAPLEMQPDGPWRGEYRRAIAGAFLGFSSLIERRVGFLSRGGSGLVETKQATCLWKQ